VLFLFLQSVFVALICRPDHASTASYLSSAFVNRQWFHWTNIPQAGLLAFLVCSAVLLLRFVLYRKPVESGFFWALLLTFLALHFGAIGREATVYAATGGLVLMISVIETSYLMAYHDELTGLPARRAFNQTLLGLPESYAIAIVDVDHFKSFNDTYGHDVGDQVLRMVALRLSNVSGGGKAYRCGGEEFSIVFSGMSAREAMVHLELVRQTIEESSFRVRGGIDRRRKPRGADRRNIAIKRGSRRISRAPLRRGNGNVSVTVSIGVAEPSTKNRDVEQVIRAADQALYRAKQGGRNRVELDNSERARSAAGSNR
jgi:GGDEF domain-containing protein